jgi:hypothetical protein
LSRSWVLLVNSAGRSQPASLNINALGRSSLSQIGSKVAYSWLAHRIRESMTDASPSPIGGANKVVEADETYVGGKAKNRAYKPEPKKHFVMTLIERGGEARSFHVKNATAKTLRETTVKIASRKSYLATDENPAYTKLGKEF